MLMRLEFVRPTHLARRAAVLPALAFALALAACSVGENWEDVRRPPEPQVQSIDHHHTITFSGRSTRLSSGEAQELERFLTAIAADPTNHVAISPELPASADTRRERRAMARAHAVARFLRERGFDPQVIATPHVPAPGRPHIDVVVRQYLVTLPPCPDWSDRPGWNFGNQPSSNLGCATATNLGVMVADPADLIRGNDLAPAVAEPVAMSIDRYRRDEVKELQRLTTTTVLPAATGGGE